MPYPIGRQNDLRPFIFIPHTFCIGADPELTVITGYLTLSKELVNSIKYRRPERQLGEPIALIACYDVEEKHTHLCCVDNLDTQCIITLRNTEEAALRHSLTQSIKKQFHDTPERLLNNRRITYRLPPL